MMPPTRTKCRSVLQTWLHETSPRRNSETLTEKTYEMSGHTEQLLACGGALCCAYLHPTQAPVTFLKKRQQTKPLLLEACGCGWRPHQKRPLRLAPSAVAAGDPVGDTRSISTPLTFTCCFFCLSISSSSSSSNSFAGLPIGVVLASQSTCLRLWDLCKPS